MHSTTRNLPRKGVGKGAGTGCGHRWHLCARPINKVDGIIFLGTPIDDQVANAVMAQLLFLDKTARNQDIKMYINSPGGSVTAGLAIYDTMQLVEPDIATYCLGQASSMGAILLTAGTAEKRYSLPNARIMIHQPLAGMQGTAAEIEINAKELKKHS